ncbi:ChaN family lipoprotein [Paralimibaculum aggregatum]|uniref:ChaN family lipoprotein n=1 Tax=Paralimibaculum aggregatum TaxID=3036245 RepID=A0ABQ6LHW4_9RHOB|nr:ChaN family lipoprotein [Limibaculum sp. NKW23]GMG82875.1 ChaN family lipoprotein [Limibaculum sp. NKW23]
MSGPGRIGRIQRGFGLAALALLGWLAGCAPASTGPVSTGHPLEGVIWDVAAGRAISEAELAAALDAADVAVLGEIHDNPAHHRRQARMVAAIAPAGIAFEMVPEASEEGILVFRAEGGDAAAIGPAIGWDRLGWPDWALYRPVFEAAGDAYVAGAAVTRDRLKLAIGASAGIAFGPGARAYGLGAPLPPAQQAAAEAEMVAAHCGALPASAAPGMVEAQRLRDARLAHAVRRAAVLGGGQVAAIMGNGHARRDRGMPLYLAASEPGLALRVLGQLETDPARRQVADYPAGALPYDYVWFAPPADREDPCAAFR